MDWCDAVLAFVHQGPRLAQSLHLMGSCDQFATCWPVLICATIYIHVSSINHPRKLRLFSALCVDSMDVLYPLTVLDERTRSTGNLPIPSQSHEHVPLPPGSTSRNYYGQYADDWYLLSSNRSMTKYILLFPPHSAHCGAGYVPGFMIYYGWCGSHRNRQSFGTFFTFCMEQVLLDGAPY